MNTQIIEDYVSFEVAILLKEKGFREKCIATYNLQTLEFNVEEVYQDWTSGCQGYVSAPTLQMTIKWLRLEKGIAIIPIISSVLDNEKFLWDVKITVAKTNETYKQGWVYEIYEQACEAAIKYCLTNLI